MASTVKYIAVDTETGGIGPEVSLLTAYFAVLNDDFGIVSDLDLAIKPNDGLYHIQAQALEVNRINLVEHDRSDRTISQSKAGEVLRDTLRKWSNDGAIKLVPVGQNVAFDLQKIYENLLNKREAEKYVSYRVLDTGSIGQFLKVCNKIPDTVSGSLSSWVEHFNVPRKEAHTARGDVEMTVDVLKAMIALGL